MSNTVLIIITGHPAAGKTRLGRRLALDLGLTFVSRDDIKEQLFESLGWNDREWSKRLGQASFELLYYVTELLLKMQRSFIIETNFDARIASPRFLALKERYGYEPLQVLCHAEDAILLQRFKRRAESSERHPGNVDHTIYDEFQARLAEGDFQPLDIGGRVLQVDTNDFERVDYAGLLRTIRSAIYNRESPHAGVLPD